MGEENVFLDRCKEIQKIAFSFNNPLIVHHYDADGLSSGAIVISSFVKKGKKYRNECIKKLDDDAIEKYAREKELVFVDLGGGNKRVNELNDVIIIDHHQTDGIEKPQANPMLHGIDGSDELSASGTAYLVFREHPDLAIVGAVGDMQWPLCGMNRIVLAEGETEGEIKTENEISFYGRYCRTLVQFLAYSDSPYIPGISYREEKAEDMLKKLGIPLEHNGKKRTYSDLKKDEKTLLISALAKILVDANQLKKANELIGESHIFPKRPMNETYEANEFSTLLNACGRHSRPDIGLKVCLQDQDAYIEARELLRLHRKILRNGIEYASSHAFNLGKFYFLDARNVIDEGIIGTICGMALRQKWGVPIIGISSGDKNTIKISSRATKDLISKGLNLGDLMKKSALEFGGVGGGHKIAAGAAIPSERINEFLLFCGEYLTKHD
ncbi:MAG: DHH family phosphoesterase [Candidatus Micrarchaeota archaeon]